MSELLSLDDRRATNPEVVGAKAANLALARARGLPVLPGFVVPADASSAAVEAGARAVRSGRYAAARGAASRVPLPASLEARLVGAGAELAPRIVARASTALDDDGVFGGALASYVDILPSELPAAVRGCWASLFAPATLDRLELAAVPPDAVRPAVLVQPYVAPEAGGLARLDDGAVELTAIARHPGALFAGHVRGARGRVEGDERLSGEPLPLPDAAAREVAGIARRVGLELGRARTEWAYADGAIVLLQVSDAPARDAPTPRIPPLRSVVYERLCRNLLTRRGPLADELLTPWIAAAGADIPVHARTADARSLLDDAIALADRLNGHVAEATRQSPAQLRDALASGDQAVAARLERVTVESAAAGQLLGAIDRIGRQLERAGRLRTADQVWRQTTGWLRAVLSPGPGVPAASRFIGDRWTGVLAAAVAGRGEPVDGVAAAPGLACGRAAALPNSGEGFADGAILVADHPLPVLAPLLWSAAGAVTREGGPGAHLWEVARSLHIPAVAGAGPVRIASGDVVAVDGDAGRAWMWRLS